MSGWEDQIASNAHSPEEAAIEREEAAVHTPLACDPNILRQTWTDMRRLKPYLYVVLKRWTEGLQRREGTPTQYSSGLYRGFYAELSRHLGVTENAVKYRLEVGIRWYAKRVERNQKAAHAR